MTHALGTLTAALATAGLWLWLAHLMEYVEIRHGDGRITRIRGR